VTVDLGANPHGVLGAHEAEDGVVVRAYRPDAQAVRVQPAGIEAELKDPAGLWEALLPKARLPLEELLVVRAQLGVWPERPLAADLGEVSPRAALPAASLAARAPA